MLPFAIVKNSREPLYEQVKRHLAQQIEGGLLSSGERLPATRALATELGISRISVVTAYNALESAGLVHSQVGRGTYVNERYLPEGPPFPWQGSNIRALLDAPEIRGYSQRASVISFSQGAPADEFLPVEDIKQAIVDVLAHDGVAALSYESLDGYPPLRSYVAQYVATLGIEAQAGDVLITGGCQQALDLAVQALLQPGDVLLTGTPTYLGILDISRARGVRAVGVPVDEYGMQTEQLEALIERHRPRLIYVAPTYQNPTGTVMPLARRRQLLDVAARYGVPVLEDGVYQELGYGGSPPLPLRALDEHEMVLYASGFSKVLLPGLRIGYLLVRGLLRERIVRVKYAADICTPALNQRAMHAFLAKGVFAAHLERVRHAIRRRMRAAEAAARCYLPQGSYWREPEGSMYLWVELPHEGPTAAELYVNGLRHGVAFAIGGIFHADNGGRYHMRLNVAAHGLDAIEEGMRRLGAAWSELVEEERPEGELGIGHIL